MPKISHNTKRREPEFYTAVLRILIKTNADALTYAMTADALNDAGLTTPTGLTWNENHVKMIMKKLRDYKTYPSFIHSHLMELLFEGTFTMKESLPLFQRKIK